MKSTDLSKPFSRDFIKYLAAFAMMLNHIALIFPISNAFLKEFLIDIGYFTAVTMCYFLVEGYAYTRSKKNYALRLLGFAMLSQFPYSFAFPQFGPFQLNMLFTLLLCFLILGCRERIADPKRRQTVCAFLILVSAFCDWGFLAPVFTIFFANAQGDRAKLRRAFWNDYALFAFLNTIEYLQTMAFPAALVHGLLSGVGILLSGFIILHLYNGQRAAHGKTFSKWFFYVFYPAHLILLIFLAK